MSSPSFEKQIEILIDYYFENLEMQTVSSSPGVRCLKDPDGTIWVFSANEHGTVSFGKSLEEE